MKYWVHLPNGRGGFTDEYSDGATQITDEYWQELLQASIDGGKVLRSDQNGYPVAVLPSMTAEQVRAKRDALIATIRWRIERHNDEVAMGVLPTENIVPVLQYIQALRDITEQQGFPTNVDWPVLQENVI